MSNNRLNKNDYKSLNETVQRMNEMPKFGPNMRPIPTRRGPIIPAQPDPPVKPVIPTYPGGVDVYPNVKRAVPFWVKPFLPNNPIYVPPGISPDDLDNLPIDDILEELPIGVGTIIDILEEIIEENQPPLHPGILDLLRRALRILKERN